MTGPKFLATLLLATTVAGAAHGQAQAPSSADDAAYCTKLGDYATRYLGDPGGQGGTRPDFDIMEGVADCRKGRTAEGIAILEKKIRSKGFTPPARG